MTRKWLTLVVFLCLAVLEVSLISVQGKSYFLWHRLVTPYCLFSLPAGWQVVDTAPTQVKTDFSRYQNGPVSFSYPTAWDISSEVFQGGEILYHTGFREPGHGAHGFVQVWRLQKSLEQFLDEAKHSAMDRRKITSYQLNPRQVAGRPGFLLEYNCEGHDGQDYRAREVFCQQGDQMYRLSYFILASADQERHQNIFDRMVDSLRIIK
ncbi:MAG: hypothetical protein HPY81_08365 [Firmicutes bacterium]|nr:hypothetical protein [Bacillota bacterium]